MLHGEHNRRGRSADPLFRTFSPRGQTTFSGESRGGGGSLRRKRGLTHSSYPGTERVRFFVPPLTLTLSPEGRGDFPLPPLPSRERAGVRVMQIASDGTHLDPERPLPQMRPRTLRARTAVGPHAPPPVAPLTLTLSPEGRGERGRNPPPGEETYRRGKARLLS